MFETLDDESAQTGESRGTTDEISEAGATPRPTRRGVLRAVGAGTLAAGFLSTGGTPAAAQDDSDPRERVYRQCERFVVDYDLLPGDVQAEVDEVLASGAYVSETTPLLAQAMDLESSYLRRDGTYYEGAIEVREAGEALVLTETTPTLDEPERLVLTSAADESRTVSVRIEDDAGEAVFQDVVSVGPADEFELLSEDEYGNYTVFASTDAGDLQHAEFERVWSVDGHGGDAELVVEPDGTLDLHQVMVDRVGCPFEIQTEPTVRVELDEETIVEGGGTSGEVVLTDAPTGVSAFDLTVSVPDGAVELRDVSVAEPFEPAEPDGSADLYARRIAGADPDDAVSGGESAVTLAEFSLYAYQFELHSEETTAVRTTAGGTANGTSSTNTTTNATTTTTTATATPDTDDSSDVGVEVHALRDDDGFALGAATQGASLDIQRGPDYVNGCLDVNGDGRATHGDVIEFFRNQHRDAWKRPEYDLTGNGSVGHADVVELFECIATM